MSYSDDRIASAPYNFVPIYDQVVWAPGDLPAQSQYHDNRFTGHLDVTLKTLSPLFIRGPLSSDQYALLKPIETDAKNPLSRKLQTRPEFYHNGDPDQPVLPSASLVGMLRNVVAAASCGRLGAERDMPIYYRDFADRDRKGFPTQQSYLDKVGSFGKNIRAGYLVETGSTWAIQPAREASADRKTPQSDRWRFVYNGRFEGSAAKIPVLYEDPRSGQLRFSSRSIRFASEQSPFLSLPHSSSFKVDYYPITFRLPELPDTRFAHAVLHDVAQLRSIFDPVAPEVRKGTLVISGSMAVAEENGGSDTPRRNAALVLEPANVPQLKIHPKALAKYKQAFENHDLYKPSATLVPGRPIFYVPPKQGEEVVRFFGFSPYFRIPFVKPTAIGFEPATPKSLLPEESHRNMVEVDLAEGLFGFVPESVEREKEAYAIRLGESSVPERVRAYRKRLSVEDAFLIPEINGRPPSDRFLCPTDDPWVPRTLAAPKPSAYPLYLEQSPRAQEIEGGKHVSHYESTNARPRGFKRYWHQGWEGGETWREHVETPVADVRWKMKALHALEVDELVNQTPDTADDVLRLKLRALTEHQGVTLNDRSYMDPLDTQHTLIRPLRPGLKFRFRIHFENLTAIELGALLWAVQPRQPAHPDGPLYLAHHLGMGKPLGLGTVRLDASVTLTPRGSDRGEGRYERLFTEPATDGVVAWHLPARGPVRLDKPNDLANLFRETGDPVEAYQRYVVESLKGDGAVGDEAFDALPHARALLRMMAWPGIRARHLPESEDEQQKLKSPFGRVQSDGKERFGNTRYMQIEIARPPYDKKNKNEYKTDPVLPPVLHALFAIVEQRSRGYGATVPQ